MHYSSLKSVVYDQAALDMVNSTIKIIYLFTWPGMLWRLLPFFFIVQRAHFDKYIQLALAIGDTISYPLTHVRDCPQQRSDSLDYSIYAMRYMEQILNGEELHAPAM